VNQPVADHAQPLAGTLPGWRARAADGLIEEWPGRHNLPAERWAAVAVGDSGSGFGEHELLRIFERFYRVRNNGHDDIEGNGLGLAIVKSIIEQHGGQIKVESKPGAGSCFSFSLPLIQHDLLAISS